MTAALAIGIDVGTTRVKAALVTADGQERHVASASTPWRTTADGTQIDVTELGDLALSLAGEAGDHAEETGGSVRAIGVTGMAETGALLNREGALLAPGFAWHHTLGHPREMAESLGRERFIRTTGRDSDILPSIIKLDLLRRRGHRFEPGQQWLNIPDYVAYRLSGVRAAEISVSCRTGLVDIAAHDWWDDALDFLGVGRWFVPGSPVPGGTLLGRAAADVPDSLRNAMVGTGGLDHPTAALGIGSSSPGELVLSLGTAEAQIRFERTGLDPETVGRAVALGASVDVHPLGDRLCVLGALPTGITLGRLAAMLGCTTTQERIELSRRALSAPLDDSVRPRIVDATFGSFAIEGIGDGITRESLWRAAMTDVVSASAAMVAQLSDLLGPQERTTMFGGWIHDPLQAQMRAEQFGPELRVSTAREPGAVGAAQLALLAAGEIEDVPKVGG